jgi:hypothetical protein
MPVTNKAKELITQALEVGTLDVPSHIAWGSGSASFTAEGSALSDEFQRNAVSDTDRQTTTIEWTGVLTTVQGNGETIQEVGLMDAASGGNMYIRDTIFPISKTNQFEYDTIFVMRIR